MSNIDQTAKAIFGAKRRVESEEQREPITAALRRVDAALNDVADQGKPDGPHDYDTDARRDDPAPSMPAIAHERAHALVAGITTGMMGELRALRDQIDELMREANERRDLLFEAIRAHAEFADAAIAHKTIVAEAMGRMRADFDKSRTPLPPARKL